MSRVGWLAAAAAAVEAFSRASGRMGVGAEQPSVLAL